MIEIFIILAISMGCLTIGALVFSAYFSDKNYRLGKFLWKLSIVTNILYSISFWIAVIMIAKRLLTLIL